MSWELPILVHNGVARIRAHTASPYKMRVAGLLDHLGRAGGLHDLFGLVLRRFDQLFVIVVKIESDVRDRQTEAVFVFREGDLVILPRKDLAKQSKRSPVVVVHHLAPQSPAPRFLGGKHLLPKSLRKWSYGLDRKAPGKIVLGIGLVELLSERMSRRRLVHANRLVEAAQNDISGLRHEIAP